MLSSSFLTVFLKQVYKTFLDSMCWIFFSPLERKQLNNCLMRNAFFSFLNECFFCFLYKSMIMHARRFLYIQSKQTKKATCTVAGDG